MSQVPGSIKGNGAVPLISISRERKDNFPGRPVWGGIAASINVFWWPERRLAA